MAEASAREARRAALCGRFAEAREHAKRAVELRPTRSGYQERRRSGLHPRLEHPLMLRGLT